jgi:hypothetical protein
MYLYICASSQTFKTTMQNNIPEGRNEQIDQ